MHISSGKPDLRLEYSGGYVPQDCHFKWLSVETQADVRLRARRRRAARDTSVIRGRSIKVRSQPL